MLLQKSVKQHSVLVTLLELWQKTWAFNSGRDTQDLITCSFPLVNMTEAQHAPSVWQVKLEESHKRHTHFSPGKSKARSFKNVEDVMQLLCGTWEQKFNLNITRRQVLKCDDALSILCFIKQATQSVILCMVIIIYTVVPIVTMFSYSPL